MDITKFLDNVEFFSELKPPSIKALASICIPREVDKKQTLFHEGDRGLSIFFLVYGTVQLHKTGPDGRRVVIRVIKEGGMFGEVVLFEESAYPVTAVTVAKSLLLVLPKHQFHCLLENREFRNDFIVMIMRKQRYLADRIRLLTVDDIRERFRVFLREHHGETNRISQKLAKKDVAAAIGATPESLSRLLFSLKNEGLLEWDGSGIVINNAFWKKDVE